jgi:hypothetical protein
LFAIFGGAAHLHADGGLVRLRAEGASIVGTLFAPGDLRRDAAIDFTVLVQDRATMAVLLDTEVELQFFPPPGMKILPSDPWCRPPRSTVLAGNPGDAGALPPVPLTRAQVGNKLLSGASVIFPVAGDWRVRMIVRRQGETVREEAVLAIGEPSSRLAVVWPWLAFPPCAIGLFAFNQRLRFRRERDVA